MFNKIAGLALLTVCIGVAAEDAPAWLKTAAEATPPAYGPKVSTVKRLPDPLLPADTMVWPSRKYDRNAAQVY